MPKNKSRAQIQLIAALRKLGSSCVFPRGSNLYERGQDVRGVFLLEQGWVKVSCIPESTSRADSEVVGPNTILALSESMSGRPYKATARALSETRLCFIRHSDLQRQAKANPDLCWAIVEFLSHDLHALYSKVQSVALGEFRESGSHSSRPC